ncbi:MAG: hypothetical protein ABL929_01000 [Ferruginibacter sp.]|nr:hypothetical protein [Ferruginibacter sp.]
MKFFTAIICTIVLLSACGLGQADSTITEEKKYEKIKETLEQTEQKNASKFITVQGDKKKNLLGQTVVKANVTNNAKIVTYKDVTIKISFYSKTKALLEEDIETVYEAIAPGASTHFKSKFFTPKGTDSVGFIVESAKF